MPTTFVSIGTALARALRNPLVREILVAVLAAAAKHLAARMKRRPTAE